MRYILLILILLSTGLAWAQKDDELLRESLKNCDANQLAMNTCARYRFDVADKKLNDLYQRKLRLLETSATKKRFIAAQRAWISFRDRACLYDAGPREESGSIWPLEYFSCMLLHTGRRIEDMEENIQCTQNGCPN